MFKLVSACSNCKVNFFKFCKFCTLYDRFFPRGFPVQLYVAIEYCRRSWRTSRNLGYGRVDLTSEARCFEDWVSIDVLKQGQYNSRGNSVQYTADALGCTYWPLRISGITVAGRRIPRKITIPGPGQRDLSPISILLYI